MECIYVDLDMLQRTKVIRTRKSTEKEILVQISLKVSLTGDFVGLFGMSRSRSVQYSQLEVYCSALQLGAVHSSEVYNSEVYSCLVQFDVIQCNISQCILVY